MSKNFDEILLEMDIKKNSMEEAVKENTYYYHDNLLKLLEAKEKKDSKEVMRLTDIVNENLSKVISCNSWVIQQSLDMAKKQLEEAFIRSGINFSNSTSNE